MIYRMSTWGTSRLTGDTLIKSILGEDAERSGQASFPISSFLVRIIELGRSARAVHLSVYISTRPDFPSPEVYPLGEFWHLSSSCCVGDAGLEGGKDRGMHEIAVFVCAVCVRSHLDV